MALMRHPDEGISHGMYRAMVEQRNEAAAKAKRLGAEAERLRENVHMWQSIAARWSCCRAGLIAAPSPCPWHGQGEGDG